MGCTDIFDRKTVKFMGIVVAFCHIVSGIVLMSFGISIKATSSNFASLYEIYNIDDIFLKNNLIDKQAIFMIFLGILCILAGIFITFIIIKKNIPLFYSGIIILIIISILLFSLIIYTAVYAPDESFKESMKSTMIKNFQSDDVKINNSVIIGWPPSQSNAYKWAKMQMENKCCGINGPKDYLKINEKNRTEIIINNVSMVINWPLTCCRVMKNIYNEIEINDLNHCISVSKNDSHEVYQEGCYKRIYRYFYYVKFSVYRLAPIIIIFQIGLIIILAYLLKTQKSAYQNMQ